MSTTKAGDDLGSLLNVYSSGIGYGAGFALNVIIWELLGDSE